MSYFDQINLNMIEASVPVDQANAMHVWNALKHLCSNKSQLIFADRLDFQ